MAGFGDGFAQGVNAVSGVYNLKRSKDEHDREEKLRATMEEANKAAMEAFNKHKSSFEGGAQGGANDVPAIEVVSQPSRMALSGAAGGPEVVPGAATGARPGGQPDLGPMLTDMGKAQPLSLGAPQSPQQAAPADVQPQIAGERLAAQQPKPQAGPAYDERDGILAGMQARRQHLMQSGLGPDVWGKDFAQEHALRTQMRSERLGDAEQRFYATGDLGGYLKTIYPLIGDGNEIAGEVKQVKGLDGGVTWQVPVRNSSTGSEQVHTMNQEQVSRLMAAARDPRKVAEIEARAATEAARAAAQKDVKQFGAEQEQDTARVKSNLKLGEIAAEGVQHRKTEAAKGGQARATDAAKPIVLQPDATLVKPDRKTGEYQEVARGGARTPGNAANPSAPNRILQLRQQASAAIQANPEAAAEIKARFKQLTGKQF